MKILKIIAVLFILISPNLSLNAQQAQNPIIHADVPDLSMIRVGKIYYMASTTMHMNPGLPIMKSTDLVNWKIVSYAYDTLNTSDPLALNNGKVDYGRGSWASSLRYHKGTYYATTFSGTTGETYIFSTKDIEKGPWKRKSFKPSLHDHSVFFEDDGKAYMVYGAGKITLVELNDDLSGIKKDTKPKIIIENASLPAGTNINLQSEGSQLFKIDGKYYIFHITWPRNGMRTVVIHRSDNLMGPYEGKIGLQDLGVAQGGLISTPEGNWFAYLFRDYGAVGRIPYLVPVKWEQGWPILGVNGKVPETLNLPLSKGLIPGIVASDEFNRKKGEPLLPLVWQWNHNPDHQNWSVGLMLLQKNFGWVGVKNTDGKKSIAMVTAQNGTIVGEDIPSNIKKIYLKGKCDFTNRTDKGYFSYSLDGENWKPIGKALQMSYTLPHFMGYRFGLFNYATSVAGGYVDFDYFRIEAQ
ncbi:MAG: glycoside hydrolase [Flavobacterium sp.]|nr:MAG: glycoside hydrolase [Flavobacterium sp.]